MANVTSRLLSLGLALIVTCAVTAQETGEKVVEYALSKEGKKVDRGECWDLVAEALDKAEANWVRPDKFGSEVDWEDSKVLPGDIIEFRKVRVKMPDNHTYEMPQHFAVIVEEISPRHYRIAHQNYNGRKRVGLMDLDLNYMVKGKVNVYRPGG